jgi:ATP-dependent DNA helicase RecG
VEFKEAQQNFSFEDLGQYFSALSNEANLKWKESARLVFWVNNNRAVVGTNYRNGDALYKLKEEVGNHTICRISFKDIHELTIKDKSVLFFEIPPAPKWTPVPWKNHFYGRDNESLQALSLYKLDRIRSVSTLEDRSSKICEWATFTDLDPDAVSFARMLYLKKHPDKRDELDWWDNMTFFK